MNNADIIKDIRRYRDHLGQARSIREFHALRLACAVTDAPDDMAVIEDLERRCAGNPELQQALLAQFIEDEVSFYAKMLMRDVNSEKLAALDKTRDPLGIAHH